MHIYVCAWGIVILVVCCVFCKKKKMMCCLFLSLLLLVPGVFSQWHSCSTAEATVAKATKRLGDQATLFSKQIELALLTYPSCFNIKFDSAGVSMAVTNSGTCLTKNCVDVAAFFQTPNATNATSRGYYCDAGLINNIVAQMACDCNYLSSYGNAIDSLRASCPAMKFNEDLSGKTAKAHFLAKYNALLATQSATLLQSCAANIPLTCNGRAVSPFTIPRWQVTFTLAVANITANVSQTTFEIKLKHKIASRLQVYGQQVTLTVNSSAALRRRRRRLMGGIGVTVTTSDASVANSVKADVESAAFVMNLATDMADDTYGGEIANLTFAASNVTTADDAAHFKPPTPTPTMTPTLKPTPRPTNTRPTARSAAYTINVIMGVALTVAVAAFI